MITGGIRIAPSLLCQCREASIDDYLKLRLFPSCIDNYLWHQCRYFLQTGLRSLLLCLESLPKAKVYLRMLWVTRNCLFFSYYRIDCERRLSLSLVNSLFCFICYDGSCSQTRSLQQERGQSSDPLTLWGKRSLDKGFLSM